MQILFVADFCRIEAGEGIGVQRFSEAFSFNFGLVDKQIKGKYADMELLDRLVAVEVAICIVAKIAEVIVHSSTWLKDQSMDLAKFNGGKKGVMHEIVY